MHFHVFSFIVLSSSQLIPFCSSLSSIRGEQLPVQKLFCSVLIPSLLFINCLCFNLNLILDLSQGLASSGAGSNSSLTTC